MYHVLNRGNGRMRIFHKGEDFEAFERVLSEGLQRYPVDLFTYCLMPNHWHLVVRPKTDDALGRWLGWVGVTHVRRHHEHYHTRGDGHLYQGRFKSFPVAEDEYFLALCRYVEANALRTGLVARAEDWQWSSLWRRAHGSAELPLSPWPVERSRNWALPFLGAGRANVVGTRRCAVLGESSLHPETEEPETGLRGSIAN